MADKSSRTNVTIDWGFGEHSSGNFIWSDRSVLKKSILFFSFWRIGKLIRIVFQKKERKN